MKKLLLLTIVAFSCNPEGSEKDLISEFIEKVVLDKSYNVYNIDEYLDIEKVALTPKSDLLNIIEFHLDNIRLEVKDTSQFEILTYQEFNSRNNFKDYKIIHRNHKEVYCVIIGGKFIPIIVNSHTNKISSFFTGIRKHKYKLNPIMLNEY